jgi:hypothetical protein
MLQEQVSNGGRSGPQPGLPKFAEHALTRAAQYVRMSTEHQKYSTENQSDAIGQYAARHNLEVVRSYIDKGKSGLRIEGRIALILRGHQPPSLTADELSRATRIPIDWQAQRAALGFH